MFWVPSIEFWGFFIAVFFGNSAIAQALARLIGESKWSLGMMMGMYVAGNSGAYLNPAVTLTNCIYRRLPWRRLLPSFVTQLLGAFAASGVVYANFISAVDEYEGGRDVRTVPPNPSATAQIFTTYPASFVPLTSKFFNEFITGAVNTFCIFAFKDENGADLKSGTFFPLAFFFLTFGMCSSFGWKTGATINFARDLGPRVMSCILGYGPQVFMASNWLFWRPLVASLSGCTVGGALYDIFIYTGDSPINTSGFGLKKPCIKCYQVVKRNVKSLRRGKDF